ncbi:GntR family transcriptional regulator [Streptomyces sp. NPDC057620]|uniref:GntR family transcriptional regulator n=1 Tax=Streptomyces sp. NPDC057620 TaxID=3346185 RepID=UPI00368E200C
MATTTPGDGNGNGSGSGTGHKGGSPAVAPIPWNLRKTDWAYQQLREWILNGRLAPGQRLSQEGLAGELGISRGPLRDALSRLATEHLVVDRPHQKWIVAEVSLADARDVYNGRAALEGMLAAAAAQAAEEDRLARCADLDNLMNEQAEAADQADTAYLRRLDRAFHDTVYALAAMPASLSALNHLRARSDRYIALYLSDASRAHASIEEHTRILAALRSGDAERASLLTRDHVLGGLTALAGGISRRQPAGAAGGTPEAEGDLPRRAVGARRLSAEDTGTPAVPLKPELS